VRPPGEIYVGQGQDCRVGAVNFALSACVLRSTTEKKVINFFEEKSSPQRKSWLRLWLGLTWLRY